MLTAIFATPIAQHHFDFTPAQLAEVSSYLLGLRAAAGGERKSNRGGWHSEGNLFGPEHRQFDFIREAITQAVFEFIGATTGYQGQISLTSNGWTVINRAGDYNAAHNHAGNFVSGALYVQVPPGMPGGEIVFSDPRFNINTYASEQIDRLGINIPWNNTHVPVAPKTGDMLVFPSWLVHHVEAFEAPDQEAERIFDEFFHHSNITEFPKATVNRIGLEANAEVAKTLNAALAVLSISGVEMQRM